MNYIENNDIYVNDPFGRDGAALAHAEGLVLVYSSPQTTGQFPHPHWIVWLGLTTSPGHSIT